MIYPILFLFLLKNIKFFLFINLRYFIIPFKKYFKETKGYELLDFGCGHGLFSYYFSKKNTTFNIISYDIDLYRLSFLNNLTKYSKIKNIHIIKDLSNLSHKKFDTILIIGVLSLFKDDDVIKNLKKLNLFLKDDGRIIISEILKSKSLIFKFHQKREYFFKKIKFTKGDVVKARNFDHWNSLFEKSGFKIQKKLNINVPLHSTIDLLLEKL